MPTDVIMPQMGESIFEGTITKWLKKPGDKVQRDEPLFEISTDKVDAEIPAPTAGVLREIKVKEGTTVQVNTVVAVIGGSGGPAATATPATVADPVRAPEPVAVAATTPSARPAAPRPEAQAGERVRSSPLVRRIARENSVSLGNVPGTGLDGRITKNDILNFVQEHGPGSTRPAAATMPPQSARPAAQTSAPAQRSSASATPSAPAPAFHELPGELVPMTPMRKKIAERMVESRRISAHVHTIFNVDMTRIVKLRA